MAKDQEIRKLHRKVESLHSSFTTKLEEKEKDIYTKIIDYFSNLLHEMGLYNHEEELSKRSSKSGLMLSGTDKVKKASAAPSVKKVAKKAVVKKALPKKPAVKKAAAKKVPAKAASVKAIKKAVAKK